MSEHCVSVSETRTDSEHVHRALTQRAESITHEELAMALSKLEARGKLTPRRRAVVQTLAGQLVRRLIAAPATMAAETPPGETEPAQTVARLFDLEETHRARD